jgi:hypothetical protein
MPGHVIAAQHARESTRRGLTEPPREPRPRRTRRAVAQALQATAHRLDPYVTAAPQARLNR